MQLKIILLFLTYVAAGCFSNVAFKLSVGGDGKTLIGWQLAANVVALLSVATITWLYKLVPMHIAYPVAQALLIVAIQVVAARLFFKEHITLWQWVGAGLVVAGILLIALRGEPQTP